VHGAEARGFVAASEQRYDLIQVALLDSFSASSAGLHALAENYLYTVEAVQDDLRHLQPGGLLAITRWVTLPPRDALKLFGAAVLALQHSGATDPASQLALARSWKTSTLLVKNGALRSEDIAAIKAFCVARSFDLAFYPGMKPQEANRYNVVAAPDLFDGAMGLPDAFRIVISAALIAPLAFSWACPSPRGCAGGGQRCPTDCLGLGDQRLCIGDGSRARHSPPWSWWR
jgi:hypothetical protein